MKKILICEDDNGIAEATELVVKKIGYEPIVLSNCMNIIEDVKTIMPNLILMDLKLPGISGESATVLLKEEKETKHIPIVIFSVDVENIPLAIQNGADDFILKPYEIENFKKVLQRLLKK